MDEDLRIAILMMLGGGVKPHTITEVLGISLDEIKVCADKLGLRPTSVGAGDSGRV